MEMISGPKDGTKHKETYPLNQPNKHITTPRVRTDQFQSFRDTLVPYSVLQCVRLDSDIDGFLCHRPISRPFPSSDRQKSTLADIDHMIPDQGLGSTGCIRVADKGP